MITPHAIAAAALELKGTPFVHTGRKPGEDGGVDCVGMLICVARKLGVEPQDSTTYSKDPRGAELYHYLEASCYRITEEEMQVGDILVFWINEKTKEPQHAAIRTETGIVHALNPESGVGRVTSHKYDRRWSDRLDSVWRLQELP